MIEKKILHLLTYLRWRIKITSILFYASHVFSNLSTKVNVLPQACAVPGIIQVL